MSYSRGVLTRVTTHWARLHMAGSAAAAQRLCQPIVQATINVVVTPAPYESFGVVRAGFTVTFNSYPGYPRGRYELQAYAEALGWHLRRALGQTGFSVETPHGTERFMRPRTGWLAWLA